MSTPTKIAWMPQSTVQEKAHALHVLGDAIALRLHQYERSPGSGAGNCWCGWARHSVVHAHPFLAGLKNPFRCVCRKPPNWIGHVLEPGHDD